MDTVRVREIEIGTGQPKICVPIAAVSQEEILKCAKAIACSAADIVEWRMDWYEDIFREKETAETLGKIRKILGEKPLLSTFRTKGEGGEREAKPEEYKRLNEEVIRSGCTDLTDIEYFMGDGIVQPLNSLAKEYRVKTVLSNHDFAKTPAEGELFDRLQKMDKAGADIAKIAVMPQSRRDVLALLAATERADRLLHCPIITMSMGKMGQISRICGEAFGSAVTFASLGRASAPGQMNLEELKTVLDILHGIGGH